MNLDESPGAVRTLAAVRDAPGRSTSDVARGLGVDQSTADYHLRRLERRRLVRSTFAGRERLWFPSGSVCPHLREGWRHLERGAAVAEALLRGARSMPQISEVCGLTDGGARSRVAALDRGGFIERRGRSILPAEDLARCLAALDQGGRCDLWGSCAPSRKRAEDAPRRFPRS